jgi:glyoxylase-like metal-dependent hydrolase (beta-lactamase superfamily II)
MKIGRYQIHLIDAGRFRLDGGAMFGVVPKVLWEKKCKVDDKNRIAMSTNLLLLEGEGRLILIDTGIGDKFDKKFGDIFGVDHSEFSLQHSLKNHGFSPDDINDVILTHLHFDHAGGATKRNEAGKIVPTFPNAKYYIQKEQLDWAKEPSQKDRASFFPENFAPLEQNDQLIILNEEMEIFPGVELIRVDGHTPAQQIVLIKGDSQNLLFAGDLIPTSSHIPIPWVMSYDLYPMKTMAEKKIILEKASRENWLIFFEHDPEIRLGTIKKTEKNAYALKEEIPFE